MTHKHRQNCRFVIRHLGQPQGQEEILKRGGGGDTHLGYGILGGKKSGIWDMRAKKSGIWDMGKSSGIWDMGVEIINF